MLADDAELLVSGLVTNALKAWRSLPEIRPFASCLRSDGKRLIIEVWDHSPGQPCSAASAGDAVGPARAADTPWRLQPYPASGAMNRGQETEWVSSVAGGMMSASEKAAWLMAQAARAYGGQKLVAPRDAVTTGPEEVGRDLARLIFGAGPGDPAAPEFFSALIARPDSPEALTVVDTHIEEVLEQDVDLAAAVDGILAGFFAKHLQSGDSQALADTGSLLWWEEPHQARAAFQCAIDLGNEHARIDLAKLHEAVLDARPTALRHYQQATESSDPDVAAEALVELGQAHAIHRERSAARAAYQQAISTRHPHWAPRAMIGFAYMMRREGDDNGARDLFGRAVDAGDTQTRAQALLGLAGLLEQHSDIPGAKAAWRRPLDTHFGFWVICTDQPSPFRVTGLDESGTVLADIDH